MFLVSVYFELLDKLWISMYYFPTSAMKEISVMGNLWYRAILSVSVTCASAFNMLFHSIACCLTVFVFFLYAFQY